MERYLEMTQVLELLDKSFMIKMLKNLFKHLDNMHKDMGNFS